MNGVDFKKGCYVGQEVVARMKHKTELRKGYALVSLSDSVSQGETIKTEENKPAGVIFSNRDGIGLALLRLDRVQNAQTLVAANVTIKKYKIKYKKFSILQSKNKTIPINFTSILNSRKYHFTTNCFTRSNRPRRPSSMVPTKG